MEILTTSNIDIFIKSLDLGPRTKITRGIELLEQFGYKLSMPYCRKMSSNLYELRIRGEVEIRIFYTFRNNAIILFYAYIKKTRKTPKRILKIAKNKLISLDT